MATLDLRGFTGADREQLLAALRATPPDDRYYLPIVCHATPVLDALNRQWPLELQCAGVHYYAASVAELVAFIQCGYLTQRSI